MRGHTQRKHGGEKKWAIPRTLKNQAPLYDGVLTDKKFKCHLCGETFNTATERDEHNRQVHPKAYRLSHLFSGKKREDEPKVA